MEIKSYVKMSIVLALVILLSGSLQGFAATKTIGFTYLAGSQTWEDAYAALTDAFEAANPDVKVEAHPCPDRVSRSLGSLDRLGNRARCHCPGYGGHHVLWR